MLLNKLLPSPAAAVAALLSVAAATSANAALTLIETETFSFVPNGSRQMTFDKFDTQGGTRVLQSVEVTVSYTKSGGSLAVDNDSETGGTIRLQHSINGTLSVSSGGVNLLDSTFNPIGTGLNAVSVHESLGIGPTSGDSTSQFNSTGNSDYFLFSPDPLTVTASGTINSALQSGFVASAGNNTFTLNFNALQTTDASGLGGLQQAFVVSSVEGFVTVKYNYDVVPEPSISVLGVIGALGLVVRRRR